MSKADQELRDYIDEELKQFELFTMTDHKEGHGYETTSTNIESAVKAHTDEIIKETRVDERELGKADVTKLRDVYLIRDDDDPIGDKAVAIRNQLRSEIVKDFDERIDQLSHNQPNLKEQPYDQPQGSDMWPEIKQ